MDYAIFERKKMFVRKSADSEFFEINIFCKRYLINDLKFFLINLN